MSWLSLGLGIASQVLGAVGGGMAETQSQQSAPSATQQGQETGTSQADRDLNQEFKGFFRLHGPQVSEVDFERFLESDPALRSFYNENRNFFVIDGGDVFGRPNTVEYRGPAQVTGGTPNDPDGDGQASGWTFGTTSYPDRIF